MTQKQQKTKKLTTGQKVDQVLEIVQGLSVKVDGLQKNQGVMVKRMDGFDQGLKGFNQRMDGFDQRISGFDRRMNRFDQKMDGFNQGLKGLDQRMSALETGQKFLGENQELILVTINEFSTRIEEKIKSTENSLKQEMRGMENRMVNKDYLDRKFAAAGIKTLEVLV